MTMRSTFMNQYLIKEYKRIRNIVTLTHPKYQYNLLKYEQPNALSFDINI